MLKDAPAEDNLNANCQLQSKVDPESKKTMLWYGTADDEESQCDFPTKIEMFKLENAIASGTLTAGNGDSSEKTINSKTVLGSEIISGDRLEENPLKGRQLDTSSTPIKYYYLVVEYPNEGDQSDDAKGGQISVTLTIEKDSIVVDKGTAARP